MTSEEMLIICFGCFSVGSFLCYIGFGRLRLYRRMHDTPTSKIKSTAMGTNVELAGKVLNMGDDGVISPLSGIQGAVYIWIFEYYGGRSKSGEIWTYLNTFCSSPYLYVHDEEDHFAAIDLSAVDLSASEFRGIPFQDPVEFNNNSFDIPEKVKYILDKSGILKTRSSKSFLLKDKYRLKEKVFTYEEPVYALGAAVACPKEEISINTWLPPKFGKRETSFERKVIDLFVKEKSNKETISKYDLDNNLVLDKTEEASLMKDIEEQVLAKNGNPLKIDYLKKMKFLLSVDNSARGFFKPKQVYLSTGPVERFLSLMQEQGRVGLAAGFIVILIGFMLLYKHFF